MISPPRPLVPILLIAFVFSPAASARAGKVSAPESRARVNLVLNRLAFGPRPGDVDRIAAKGETGMREWVESQLHPEKIDDDALEAKLKGFKTYGKSTAELLREYRPLAELAKLAGLDVGGGENDADWKKKVRAKVGKDRLPPAIDREWAAQKLIRAVESRRQLEEVLADFWFNHFNVDVRKGKVRWLLPDYERAAIRAHLFGRFSDLLSATAHHPAMLFYLDNQQSQASTDPKTGRARDKGINENYARELMELHTLGVDGGYTQKDVTELARILTGWGIEGLNDDPKFRFRPRLHDAGKKSWLGNEFPAGGGQEEGEKALLVLARSPATAKHLSRKLAQYFLADRPPEALVERLAKKFRETDGDLAAWYRALFYSPEFAAKRYAFGKVKKPFQYVVSAMRALGAEWDGDLPEGHLVAKTLESLGEMPYRCQPPTGYPTDAATWVNPGAMVVRLGFAVKLAKNRVDGIYLSLPTASGSDAKPGETHRFVDRLAGKILNRPLAKETEAVIEKEMDAEIRLMADGEVRPLSLAKAVGMIIGSPDFQRK